MMPSWTYSYSQLKTFRLCPRRYYYSYVLGEKEPPNQAMSFSSWLIHAPLEHFILRPDEDPLTHDALFAYWQSQYDLEGDISDEETGVHSWKSYATYSPSYARDIFDRYCTDGFSGEPIAVEDKFYIDLDGFRYVSKPDFITREPSGIWTNDVKLTTSWDIKPLRPDDDQFIGQAISCSATGFRRVLFQLDRNVRTNPRVAGPLIEEHLLDDIYARDWKLSTIDTIRQIERCRKSTSWPKWTDSDYAFGRECHYRPACLGDIEP